MVNPEVRPSWDRGHAEGRWRHWWFMRTVESDSTLFVISWTAAAIALWWGTDDGERLAGLGYILLSATLLSPLVAFVFMLPFFLFCAIVGLILDIAEHIAYARGYRYGRDKLGY